MALAGGVRTRAVADKRPGPWNVMLALVRAFKLSNSRRLAAFLSGCDDSHRVAAKLFVKTVRYRGLEDIPTHDGMHPSWSFPLLYTIDFFDLSRKLSPGDSALRRLRRAVLARDLHFLKLLVSILHITALSRRSDANSRGILAILINLLRTMPGMEQHAAEALDAGLLLVVGRLMSLNEDEPAAMLRVFRNLLDALEEVCNPSYSASLALKNARRSLVKESLAMPPAVSAIWTDFLREDAHPFAVELAGMENNSFSWSRVCNHAECTAVIPRAHAKKCAGCRIVSYCSVACQKIDWRRGDHKNSCSVYARSPHFIDSYIQPFRFHQRRYLNAILHNQYSLFFPDILAAQARLLAAHSSWDLNPESAPRFVPLIDTTTKSPSFRVLSEVDSESARTRLPTSRKAGASLAVLRIRQSPRTVEFVAPIYSSGDVSEAVSALARDIRALRTKEVEEEVLEGILRQRCVELAAQAGWDVEYSVLPI